MAGCDKGADAVFPKFKQLNILLTDGPIDLDAVNIDLKMVFVRGPQGTEEIKLGTNAGIYNLLDLQNGITELIASAQINLDEIHQVRFVLGEQNSVVAGGQTHELKIPSGNESGLKINVCLDLTGVTEYDLILDWDAAKSVHVTGNGLYIMKPAIDVVNPDAQCLDAEGEGESEEEETEEEEEEEENSTETDCTLTQGYWKTHTEAGPAPFDETWSQLENGSETIFFGTGLSYYTIFQTPPTGNNAYLILAHQWIAAQLNVLRGASIPDEVLDAWNQGAELLTAYEGAQKITVNTPDGQLAVQLAEILDDYNNGVTGPGKCE